MPRVARTKGEFSTYHIVQRGNERKNLFHSEDDKARFLDTLTRMKEKYQFKLEAYCLMDNHVHLLIDDNGNDISQIVKSMNVSYAYYFNRTYKRTGHLFQDRFKSEVVDDDNYLLEVSAYIHNNPVKAGMVKSPREYQWSSFNCYMDKDGRKENLVDVERVLSLFSTSKKKAVEEYAHYAVKFKPTSEILDVQEDILQIKKENVEYIDSYEKGKEVVVSELKAKGKQKEDLSVDKGLRREIVIKLRQNSSLTLTEIGQLVGGLSSSSVCKTLKQ